jgi:hypothetical protein
MSNPTAIFVGRALSHALEQCKLGRLLVAQALLPVRVLLPLSPKHSQEWLCYSTFSAAYLAAGPMQTRTHEKESPA